jgi:two-component system response regulator
LELKGGPFVPQTKRVLLVEDNPDDEVLTLDALRSGGATCEIVVVRDGSEALDYLYATGNFSGRDVRSQPCLVLLDLKLPKLSGFDVLHRIRTDERTRLMPVVLLTSSSQEEDIVRGYASGANSFVRKPVRFESFMESVRSLGQYWVLVNEVSAG